MTRVEFKDAFRYVANQEFAWIPTSEDEIDYTFSEKFEKRMDKLIKAEKSYYWHLVNTASKRVAIAMVALACILSTAFSVKAVRTAVVNFIVETFDGFLHITTEGETTKEITYEYIPGYIPEGYTLYEETRSILHVKRTYTNKNGDMLILNQDITAVNGNYLDTDHGEVSQITVDGKEVIFYIGTDHETIYATWIADGYNLSVMSYGDLSEEEILKIIQNYK